MKRVNNSELEQQRSTTAEVTDYIDVTLKLASLGCLNPQGGIVLLPVNFDTALSIGEFLQASESSTVKKLLKAEGVIVDDIVERSQRPMYVKNKSHDWVAPIMLVSAALYSQNPSIVSVALSVLANYATDFLKGFGESESVTLEVVLGRTKNGNYKKISYKGPAEGIKGLTDVLDRVANE